MQKETIEILEGERKITLEAMECILHDIGIAENNDEFTEDEIAHLREQHDSLRDKYSTVKKCIEWVEKL